MYVSQINSNQPSNRGYLNKNTKSKIKNIVKYEVREAVNKDETKYIKNLGKRVIKKLESYASKLHKDSFLSFDDFGIKGAIESTENDCIALEFRKYNSTKITSLHSIDIQADFQKLKNKSDLENLEKVADELEKIPPKEVDNMMFKKKFNNLKDEACHKDTFWRRFYNAYNRYKADKLAKEYNVKSDESTGSWGKQLEIYQKQILNSELTGK